MERRIAHYNRKLAVVNRTFTASLVTLVLLLCAVNTWRAATQSFTIDEAYAYREYTTKATGFILGTFHSSHHVLFTVLSKLSWKAFGVSEFTLRLPTLLAGFAFLAALAAISRRIAPAWGSLVAFLAIASNPLLLDHLSCARGYGLGIAFLAAALLLLTETSTARLVAAGCCLGLSVASNLTFLFPSTALIIAAAVVHRRIWPLAAPFLVCSAAFLAAPILRTGSMDLFFGNDTLEGTLDSIVNLSIPPSGLLRDIGKRLAPLLPWAGFAGGGAMFLWLRKKDPWSALVCLTAPLTLLLVVTAHYGFGVRYPYSRTGLYFVLLILLAIAALARLPRASWIVYPVLLLIAAVHLASFRTTYYGDWPHDADNRAIALRIKNDLRPARTQKLCASWVLESSLNFYREVLRIDIPEVTRGDLAPGCTIFALASEDEQIARKENLKIIYRGPVSGTILAVRQAQ